MTSGMKVVDKETFAAILFAGEERVTRRSELNKRERHVITGPLWCEDAEEFEIDLGEYLLLEDTQGKYFIITKHYSLGDVINFLEGV